MKLIIALAAAGLVSSLTTIASTPAHAQKDPACVEKCNRENKTATHSKQAIEDWIGAQRM